MTDEVSQLTQEQKCAAYIALIQDSGGRCPKHQVGPVFDIVDSLHEHSFNLLSDMYGIDDASILSMHNAMVLLLSYPAVVYARDNRTPDEYKQMLELMAAYLVYRGVQIYEEKTGA